MTEFRDGFAACLAELEAVTAELRAADPEQFEQMRRMLGRRQAAIEQVAPRVSEAAPEQQERLRALWHQGEALEERLKLVQAAAREKVRELYRLQFHLRAVGGGGRHSGASGPSSVELLG